MKAQQRLKQEEVIKKQEQEKKKQTTIQDETAPEKKKKETVHRAGSKADKITLSDGLYTNVDIEADHLHQEIEKPVRVE